MAPSALTKYPVLSSPGTLFYNPFPRAFLPLAENINQ
jgi:hypothetical protein